MTTAITEQGQALAWLTSKAPHEVDKALASRMRSCGVAVNWMGQGRCELSIDPKRDTSQATAEAEHMIAVAMQPAAEATLTEWLVRLSVLAPKRAGSSGEEALRVEAYLDELAKFPADVVKVALTVRRWKFFPSMFELAEVMDELTLRRRAILGKLRTHKPAEPSRDERLKRRVSAADAARMTAEFVRSAQETQA